MCGRYTNRLTWRELVELYRLSFPEPAAAPNLPPRYNIAPTQDAPVVRRRPDGRRELVMLRWGLAPFWLRDLKGPPMINAKAETLEEKAAFREAFRRRRCLAPADGFYEWATTADGRKQPYYVVMADGSPMAFAALWESNRRLNVESFTIVTTRANAVMAPLHDRMPVILRPADFDRWLAPSQPAADLLEPLPDDALRRYPVGPKVGSHKNDSPELIEPLALGGE